MGWTSVPYRKATVKTMTAYEALQFLQKENREFEFSMFHFVPAKTENGQAEAYMVMRHREKMKVFICCTIMTTSKGEIYWKDIEESMHPNYYNCPAKFFDFVKAPNLYAEQWRLECKKLDIKFVPIPMLV